MDTKMGKITNDQERRLEIQKRIKKREQFLEKIYDESQGSTTTPVSLKQLSKDMGLPLNQTVELFGYYKDKGFLNSYGNEKAVFTQQGIDFFEKQKTAINMNSQFQTMSDHKYGVFISHIHENEPVAQKLKEYFYAIFNNEVDIFISGDPHNIPAGQDWFATIIEGIRKCDCMIILCSPKAVERHWIHFEAGAAAVLSCKIIPLCFAGLNPGMLPSPLDHIRTQAIDCSDPDKLKQHFDILINSIAGSIGGNVNITDVVQSEFYKALLQAYQEQLQQSRGRIIYQLEDDYQI